MGLFGRKKEKKEKTKMFFNSVEGLNINPNEKIELEKMEGKIVIRKALTTIVLEEIDYKDIVSIYRYDEREVIEKNKSVLGRAIIGGVLTGGIGAVVGGISGVGTKNKKGKLKFFIDIEYFKNNSKSKILLEDYFLIGTDSFINSIQQEVNNAPKNNAVEENSEIDIPDQIRKLSKLFEDNIITEEEFNSKKQELLSRL